MNATKQFGHYSLLYFTDVHFSVNNPANRVDDFAQSVKDKFTEIYKLADELCVTDVVIGGDLFHHKGNRVTHQEVNAMADMISNDYSLYVVGNHDIVGGNFNTVYDSAIGTLCKLGKLVIPPTSIRTSFEHSDLRVNLGFGHYYEEIDSDDKNGYRIFTEEYTEDRDVNILFMHSLLTPKPYFPPYTLISDIAKDEFLFDVCLSGHFHEQFKPRKLKNKLFCNPGSLTRREYTPENLIKKPSVLHLNISEGRKVTLKVIPLKSAKKAEDIFKKPTELHSVDANILDFAKSLAQDNSLEHTTIEKIMSLIAQNDSISEDIRNEATKYLKMAKETVDE